MNKRKIIFGIAVLGILWLVVFLIANQLIQNIEEEARVESLPTPRPPRDDVPELLAPTATPTETPPPTTTPRPDTALQPSRTPTNQPSPTASRTPRPTAAFTLSSLEVNTFQRKQQLAFEELLAEQATLEIPRDSNEGAYPIRLAIEDLDLLASVVVVQTDPDFNIVTPRNEVGFYALTSKIGAGGNSVMVGHVAPGRVFNKLLDAKIGQIVRVTDEFYEDHYYRITEIIRFPYEIGKPEDHELGFQYMYDDSEERITLVTCYPEDKWTHRFVVRATPIEPPKDSDD